jgi:hypothetical protein
MSMYESLAVGATYILPTPRLFQHNITYGLRGGSWRDCRCDHIFNNTDWPQVEWAQLGGWAGAELRAVLRSSLPSQQGYSACLWRQPSSLGAAPSSGPCLPGTLHGSCPPPPLPL